MPPEILKRHLPIFEFDPSEDRNFSAEGPLPLDQKGELEALAFRQELDNISSDLSSLSSKEAVNRLSRFKQVAGTAIKKAVEIPAAIKARTGKSSLPWGKCECGCGVIAKLKNHLYGY